MKEPNTDYISVNGSLSALLRQGSNLDFSDPESDVLPVTPRSNLEAANIKKISVKINQTSPEKCRGVACNTPTINIHLPNW
jgi:hypothetical protein